MKRRYFKEADNADWAFPKWDGEKVGGLFTRLQKMSHLPDDLFSHDK